MRTRIAACSPKDAVAVPSLAATAACLSTWAGGLLFGADGVLTAVSLHQRARDASQAAATTSLATTIPAAIKDCYLSRRAPRVVRWSREAAALPYWMLNAARQRAAHPSRFAPAAFRPRGAIRAHAGASPQRLQNALPSRKWHLGVGCRKLRLPRPCRIPAGCLVSQSVEVASDNAAIQQHQNGASVPLAPRRHQKRMFSSLAAAALHADLAPRHYRDLAWRKARSPLRFASFSPHRPGSDGAAEPATNPRNGSNVQTPGLPAAPQITQLAISAMLRIRVLVTKATTRLGDSS